MDISVIIPVYNCEKYIERTLECILKQGIDFGNIPSCYIGEIIVVNDGSTDTTLDKIKHFAEKHKSTRLHIITQPNLGVSNSRNKGLEMSKGKYIYFADADDYMLLYSLIQILDYATKNNAEIVRFSYSIIHEGSINDVSSADNITRCLPLSLHAIVDFDGYLDISPALGGSMLWHILFSRGAIGDIRFDARLSLEEDYIFEYPLVELKY